MVVADVTDMTDVGLDRHLSEQSNDNKMDDSGQESQNVHDKTTEDIENITSDQNDEPANSSEQASQASHVSPKQKQKEYSCYYCDDFQPTNNVEDYERHVINKHPKKRSYPTKVELERLGLKAQGKNWEI
jgi:hypothetical protein